MKCAYIFLVPLIRAACPAKGKAFPVTVRGDPQGCETSRLPHSLDNRLVHGGKVVSDLQRITGYVSWLAAAMNWPAFLATLIPNRVVYWITRLHQLNLLTHPRLMKPPHRSIALYTDATSTSVAAIIPGRYMVQNYTDYAPVVLCSQKESGAHFS
jgi:hypothetical protein